MRVSTYARRVLLGVIALLAINAGTSFAQSRSVVVLTEAPIMLLPDANRTPLSVVSTGQRLVSLGVEGQWVRVEFQDSRFGKRVGYVESRFVRVEAPPPAPSVQPAPAAAPAAPVSRPATPAPTAVVTNAPRVSGPPSAQALTFRKVDYAEVQGEQERSRSARLVLDPVARTIVFADEGGGEAKGLFARIPYESITKIVYEQSAHRRYGAGVMVSPLLFFTKGKKHWLTMEFQNVAALPQGFVYARLDKDNYRQILSALRAGTGVTVEEHIED
jgi:hypothetical protein